MPTKTKQRDHTKMMGVKEGRKMENLTK